LLLCLLFAACGAITPTPPPDTATIPPGTFGPFDNDTAAINLASWAFAVPAHTEGDPVVAARAAAAVDYLAGELSTNPRWLGVSALTKMQMLQARIAVRRVLGIVPDATSQGVVDALLGFVSAWLAGNQPAAMQSLAAPIFTLPPDQVFRILSNMPYVQSANIATSNAVSGMLLGASSD
jgi:hypothetical protein